ncbi:MAG TPA: hypothetical protein VJQ77_05695 [Novosphingobium sp.]|nr:hypothetical protein [Novosphingobium sp.]
MSLATARRSEPRLAPPPRIAYFVHDLNDPAVERRIAAFSAGGADVAVAGFYRREPVRQVSGTRALALHRSHNGRLLMRAVLVLRRLLFAGKLRRHADGAQVLVARTLEMLVLAAGRREGRQALVYECLDIHRVMLRRDLLGRAMRALERMLLRRCALVVTSSPAFASHYFRGLQKYRGEVLLVENKVAGSAGSLPAPAPAGPPWRIGWFGMLRCAKSLAILRGIVERSQGMIEVVLAGIPSHNEFDDFEREVRNTPGLSYAGPYSREDLPRLYGSVHFAWCIDYFEEGANSEWLLPNRLYESLAFGAVPIALADVECGRWLEREGLGLRVAHGSDAGAVLGALAAEDFLDLQGAVRALPRGRVAFDDGDHLRLVARLGQCA